MRVLCELTQDQMAHAIVQQIGHERNLTGGQRLTVKFQLWQTGSSQEFRAVVFVEDRDE